MATARTVADRDVNFGSYEVNTLAIARAILAERQRCADVAKSVWKEAQASKQFDTVKAVSRIRCRIDTGAAA